MEQLKLFDIESKHLCDTCYYNNPQNCGGLSNEDREALMSECVESIRYTKCNVYAKEN